jgi:hypothetical protein
MRDPDRSLEIRLSRWLAEDANRILCQYLLAVGLGVGSVAVSLLGGSDAVSRLELGLLLLSAGVLFYMALANLGDRAV